MADVCGCYYNFVAEVHQQNGPSSQNNITIQGLKISSWLPLIAHDARFDLEAT